MNDPCRRFANDEMQAEYERALAALPRPTAPQRTAMHPKQHFRINYTFSAPGSGRQARVNRSESVNLDAENAADAQRRFREDFEDENPGCALLSVTVIPVGSG